MASSISILFIGTWSIVDGLTQSTILPHLKTLAEFERVESIIFVSVERKENVGARDLNQPKVKHIPLYSRNLNINIVNKLFDFYFFPKQLTRIINHYNIDLLICRGSPAGALGYKVWKTSGVPFYVESFEPHADYMLESGTWKKWDPRYIWQRMWEEKQKKYASGLMPVANNYKLQLLNEKVKDGQIFVMPCEVDFKKFGLNQFKRKEIREKLKIPIEGVVGIYVGKFGDIYYDKEAFEIFLRGFNYFSSQHYMIIVSPQPDGEIVQKLNDVGCPADRCFVINSHHDEVPDYLSASDFAYAFYKPSPSKIFLSPVKLGEYWACGLPVLIPDGIGDDSQILKETGLGVVMEDLNKPEKYFKQLEELIIADKKEEIRQLAIKHRNPEITRKVYEKILGLS